MQEVDEMLDSQDFMQVEQENQLSGKTFYVDHHCSDVFAFPADQRDFLEQGPLIKDGYIVIQVGQSPPVRFSLHRPILATPDTGRLCG